MNMEKRIKRVRSVKDITLCTLLIIIGIILAFIPCQGTVHLAGYLLIATGSILAIALKNGYRDVETKETYFKKELSFLGNMKTPILSALSASPEQISLREEGKGQVLLLRIYYGKKSGKAYLQLFEYIPHQYEPCSGVYEYELSRVQALLK